MRGGYPRVVLALIASVATASALCVVGCKGGKPPEAGAGPATAAASGDMTLRVVRNLGGRQGFTAHWEAWKAAFERDNPGWTMELIDLGNADGAEYYKARAATGDMPEVIQTWALTDYLADNGIIVPLPDDYYSRHGIPTPLPYKGKFYTSQGGLQLVGIAVNKDLWDSAGVKGPPMTWDELMSDLAALKAAGVRPLVYGGKEWSAAMPLTELLQIDLYDYVVDPDKPSWNTLRDQGKTAFATDPVVRKAVERAIYLVDHFVDKGALSDGYNEEQRDFYSGNGATWIMGCWIGGDLEANKVEFNVEYWPIPSMTGKEPKFISNTGGQSGWAISTTATGEKHDKAVAVLDEFYDSEVYQLYLNGEAMLNIRTGTTVTGPKTDWAPAQRFFDQMDANYKAYGGAAGSWRSCGDKWPAGMEMSVARVMQEIIAGQRDVDALLKMLDDDWDNARKGE